jgi:N-acetylneuraminic acid mutarotase
MCAFFPILRFRVLLVAGLIAVTSLSTASATSAFTTINVPAAGTAANQGTAVTAIDAAGDVAGIYVDASGNEHAFVLPAGGTITPFDASGTGGGNIQTIPIGFDTNRDIAGLYHDASGRVHGFVRAASTGTITILDVPGEDTGNMEGTYPVCINGSGEIAGVYSTTVATASGTNSFSHGFVRSASGVISTFDAATLPTSYGSTNPGTIVISINASGEVSGFYIDGIGAMHGFLRDAGGTITTFEDPNAGTGSQQGTIVTGIDAAGDVIGVYIDANNAIHGFVRNGTTGAYTIIDAPGAGTGTYQGTYPDAFDAAGDISGSFTDANNVGHGFVLPANGTIVTYDAPDVNATASLIAGSSGRATALANRTINASSLNNGHKNSSSFLSKIKSFLSKSGGITSASGGATRASSGLFSGGSSLPYATASLGNLFFNSVNASGQIVGLYTNGDAVIHSYLRAANGTITTFDAPNAGTGAQQGTGGLAINASGTIVGGYIDTNSVLHGFIFAPALTATTTALQSQSSTSIYGGPITLTATVSSAAGAPPNGETVYFKSGATTIGSQTLSGGTAELTTTDLTVGAYSITAVYPGDLNFSGSTSTAVSQTVSKATSSTTLTSSPNPSSFEELVTLTATVSGQLGGIATGTMTFSNNGVTLGTAPVNGSAVFTFTALPQTTNTIKAVYSGDSNFYGSTSNTVSQVVGAEVLRDWTWMGGSSTMSPMADGYYGQPGVYGTLGTPAAGNVPGGRTSASSWADSSGNIWLFGGDGFDANENEGYLSDIWEFNPSTNQWTWMGGSSTVPCNYCGQSGVYGTKGTPAAGNIPGGRQDSVSWTDKTGHLWLFGGDGYDANGYEGYLNDLWEFNPSTNQWAWMGGSSTCGTTIQSGVYGTLGTPAAGNIPGGRDSAVSWTDSSGNLWLFGGYGFDANGNKGYLNDLWEFNPTTNHWAWMDGSSTVPVTTYGTGGKPGVYGTLGTPAAANIPGSRWGAVSWTDSSGNLWLFGGWGFDADGENGLLNDLWEFNPSTNKWAWMGGSSTMSILGNGEYGEPGVYGTLGTPAAGNISGGRYDASSWTDSSGNLWLFGGWCYGADGSGGSLNDLWEFNPSTNEWAWMGGSSTVGSFGSGGRSGVYGTLGTPAAGNVPGGRVSATSRTDSSGHLWLFGGQGFDADHVMSFLNDLWEYQPSTANATATTTTLTPVPTPNPSTYGVSVTLTASVTSTAGAPPNGENVTFLSGTTTLGTAQLSSGVASLNSTALPAGTDSISAVYGGDANFAGSTSTAVSQVVSKATSSTTLTSSLNPSRFRQSVNLTATVTGQYGGTATGTVTFSNGSTTLGSVSLSGGSAVLATTAALPQGTDSITAVYGGDSNFTGSTSNTVSQVVNAQASASNEWTWMDGSSTAGGDCTGIGENLMFTFCGRPGVYGVIGTPAATNTPGGRYSALSWTDSSGNFWLFGGSGVDSAGSFGFFNDLWKFNPSTDEWTWMGGSNTVGSNGGQPGVYGTLGTPAATNVPSSRINAVGWTDNNGNLWLFGGWEYDGSPRNDLWEFNPSNMEWTWMGGSSTSECDDCVQYGVYGTLGTPAAKNIPAGRSGAVSWTDSSGNFWLFGGVGWDSAGDYGPLNDLWEFEPTNNEWAWMGGSKTLPCQPVTGCSGPPGVYGTLGTPAAGNIPGGRVWASSWTDSSGHFWLFGGQGSDVSGYGGDLSDLWEFNPLLGAHGEWAWMGGSDWRNQSGVYGILGVAATTNVPGERQSTIGWTNSSGNSWLFGGSAYAVDLNDVWAFNPFNLEWTWMGGSNTVPDTCYSVNDFPPCGISGVYGMLATPATGNIPGSRDSAVGWTDRSGNLWLFGGEGYDSNGQWSALNDLWEYQPLAPTTTKTTTTLTPAPTPNPSYYGESVTLTASVSSTAGAPPNGENVTFLSGTTSLGTAQLSGGSASLATTALPVGTDSITAVYGGDANFAGSTSTAVSQTVNKAAPSVTTWPTASSITYGQTLASSTLSGGASTPAGSFAFTTPTTRPNAGTASQSVTFTPTDATDYSTLTGTASVTVNKATPSVTTWPTASSITYGQTLASSTLSGGASTPAGSFAFTTPTTAPGAGTASQSVTFTPTDATDYNTLAGTASVTVNKATPSVTTWPTASSITYGQTLASSTLSGGASTPAGSFAFTTPTTTPNAGTASQSVTFTPTDTTDYSTLTGTASVTVNKATPSVTTWPTASSITYGQTLASSTLSGGASTPAGSFAFTTPTTAPNAGTASQSVTFTPTDATDYSTLTGTASVTVNKATPSVTTWPTASSITYGQTLASSTLSGGASTPAGSFAFTTPTTAPNAGTASQSVTFTPTDATDYSTLTGTASVTVNKASSSTILASSVNPSANGQSVTFTATVTGQYGGTPSGTVTFSYGSTSLGSPSLISGVASLATTALPLGTDTITAVYSGDTNFTGNTSNAVSQLVEVPNPVPLTSGITPSFANAGGAAFTLTVNGSGFTAGSTVYWGTSALVTTFGSATQLTAQVPAADIATGGITVTISVITPSPGGGTSNSFQFEVDSSSGTTTGPTFSSVTQTVTAGSPASYPVTLPSTVESASVTCLNLPTGATCSYSATTNTVTITTSSTTPKGTYQVTVVFMETVSGAASGWILLPFLLLPLMFLRRKMASRGVWITACLGLVLLAAVAYTSGCGGSSGGSSSTPPPQTHQAVSSGTVSITIQ